MGDTRLTLQGERSNDVITRRRRLISKTRWEGQEQEGRFSRATTLIFNYATTGTYE
jgi:hypothetical protein